MSVDSMQVYRGMDIGTAKATREMQERVTHHLLDIRDPEEDMAVAEFQAEGRTVLDGLSERGVHPVICGGSGLHYRSLVDPLRFPPSDSTVRSDLEELPPDEIRQRLLDLDSAAGEYVDLANPRRVIRALEVAVLTGLVPSARAHTREAGDVREYRSEIDFVAIGLDPGPDLGGMVEDRFDVMLEQGLLAEIEALRPRLGKLAGQAVGYKEMMPVVAGEVALDVGRDRAIQATRALAKRQRTFFRRDPRIFWVPWSDDPGLRVETAIGYLNEKAQWSS